MIRWNKIIIFVLLFLIITASILFTWKSITHNIILGLDLQGGFEILYQVSPLAGEKLTSDAINQAIAAISKRINIIGVSEPDITKEGSDRIRVKLAGVTDQAKAREILGKPAKLTFRNEKGEILLSGNDLVQGGASVVFNNLNEPLVSLKLKDAKKFADITKEYLGRPIAIYLDETMLTNPVVQDVITGGAATISGHRTVDEAKELAELLNAGALPVELKEIQSNSVGASLGLMALEKTLNASIIATIIILLFMLIYYRLPGFVAVISLITYVYLLLLTFDLLNVVLTLPGIAAFVLGIGMAVDANIIMYERIKEEIRNGKSIVSATRAGSKQSFNTILDANLTTIIAAFVLFFFGIGAIQGFAITLIISILLSMLTNVLLSRVLLSLLVEAKLFNNIRWFGVKGEEINAL